MSCTWIQILSLLTDTGPITGAEVEATVTVPAFVGALVSYPAETHDLVLYDDGMHGDAGANDGLYGNVFRRAVRPGSYDIVIRASGDTKILGAFTRRARKAFNFAPGTDSDQDGMEDGWEIRHGLDPNFNDRDGDPDCDGLKNFEEYEAGTDPENSDTDMGGENDGSETRMGGDPTTNTYVTRRRDEGKNTAEIMRSLKRYVARETYKHIQYVT